MTSFFKLSCISALAWVLLAEPVHAAATGRLRGETTNKRRSLKGSQKGSQKGSKKSAKKIRESASKERRIVSQVSLGNIRPEGVTEGPGSTVFVSELLFGGVRKVDLETGEVEQVVESPGFATRGSNGLWYSHGAIWVAGTGPGSGFPLDAAVYVYDANSGEEIAACTFEGGGFVNDVVVAGDTLFATDSTLPAIYTLNVDAALNGECLTGTIDLPPDVFTSTGFGEFKANGIVAYKEGLIVGNGGSGGIYFVNLNDVAVTQFISAVDSPVSDGLLVYGDILYSVENFFNQVAVYHLDYDNGDSFPSAERVGIVTSPLFDTPTTVAMYKDYLVLVNARFGIGLPAPGEADVSTFAETFDAVAVPKEYV